MSCNQGLRLFLLSAMSSVFATSASACLSASLIEHHILPKVPSDVRKDLVVLKVILDKKPYSEYDFVTVRVLSVIRGRFNPARVNLHTEAKTSCETLGVIGKPGYVVLSRDKLGWNIVRYRIVKGEMISMGY